jgi:hypothetical protein
VTKNELLFLKHELSSYYDHMTKNGSTSLLPRFMGLFFLKFSDKKKVMIMMMMVTKMIVVVVVDRVDDDDDDNDEDDDTDNVVDDEDAVAAVAAAAAAAAVDDDDDDDDVVGCAGAADRDEQRVQAAQGPHHRAGGDVRPQGLAPHSLRQRRGESLSPQTLGVSA